MLTRRKMPWARNVLLSMVSATRHSRTCRLHLHYSWIQYFCFIITTVCRTTTCSVNRRLPVESNDREVPPIWLRRAWTPKRLANKVYEGNTTPIRGPLGSTKGPHARLRPWHSKCREPADPRRIGRPLHGHGHAQRSPLHSPRSIPSTGMRATLAIRGVDGRPLAVHPLVCRAQLGVLPKSNA